MNKKYIIPALTTSLAAFTANGAINLTFDTETFENAPNGYIGGSYSGQLSFDQWFGGSDISIADGVLKTGSTSGTRTGAYAIDGSALSGAGDYELLFDITSYTGETNDNAFVSIWSGSGYDLINNTSPDGLNINTQVGSNLVIGEGSAVASELTSLSIQNTTIDESIAFTYDGTSALVFFFGAQTGGWPFPKIEYDNIRVQSSPIPEPATWLWVAPFAAFVLIRRRPQTRRQ